jgi:hypothetical protein
VAALDLVTAAARVPELPMRAALLAGRLRELPLVDGVLTLEKVVQGALQHRPEAVAVYSALVPPDVAALAFGPGLLAAMGKVAGEGGHELATLWLDAALEPREPEGGSRRRTALHRDVAELSLGERRSLARLARGDTLRKLLADADPVVIEHLLANPRTTEAVVLAITSRRPTVTAALEAVLASPRFGARHSVRLSLARNPHLRDALAASLLVLLNGVDLEAIRDDGTLPTRRREWAALLLEARSRSG